ncbi:DUF6232 family protein [Flavobacterium cerinum]|uniref:DUF6232 family protein n=1 Tax=Flavobacterium cerinum TaxID=2502784 RepID=A0ABY5IP59_9FLAO|nr:DUF6232 family protein [Flavobacterium cerinum]UUC44623.1 DUF6232 family protein [Flavobacterium cerinum]
MEENKKEKKTNEKVFYRDLTVKVTQFRYITDNKTYVIKNISFVTINKIIGCRFCARFVIITGFIALFIPNDFQLIIGAILIVLGVIWHICIKDLFTVCIGTNGARINSITSSDENYIKKIVDAVNQAIIHRG